jgi:predicted NAD/FAD-dependent oxidoreductase
LESTIGVVPFAPCWTLMLVLSEDSGAPFDGAFLPGPVLSWAARNHSKPGRSSRFAWVLHAHAVWSEEYIGADPDWIRDSLLAAALDEAGLEVQKRVTSTLHFWRYAQPKDPLDRRFVFREDLALSASGDWCSGPRVEGAYVSGSALGQELSAILRS